MRHCSLRPKADPPKRQDSRPDVSHDSRDSVYNIHRECYEQLGVGRAHMTPSGEFSRRNFLTTAAASAAATLLPKALMANPPQDPVVNAAEKDGKPVSREKVSWRVLPFPMQQVRLGDGLCKIAMEADRQYLHSLPPDRLLHTFTAAYFPKQCRHHLFGETAGRMGGAGLRTPRPLCGRSLPFGLCADVRQFRRRRA